MICHRFSIGYGDALLVHKSFEIGFVDAAVASHGLICLDMPRLDPVDNGFGRHVAILAGLKNSEYVLHG
jgi:hypothetical protein